MTTTRRSTRRTAASAEPAQLDVERRAHTASPPPEPPKKRGRKGKAAAAQVESESDTQSQTVTRVTATSRAASASTTAASTFSKRTTRAAKAAGVGSPLRALGEADPKSQTEKKRKRTRLQTASATPDPEPPKSEPAQDENNDEQGLFFSQSEHQISSPDDCMRAKILQLEARVTELEANNASLSNENTRLRNLLKQPLSKTIPPPLAMRTFSQHISNITPPFLKAFSQPSNKSIAQPIRKYPEEVSDDLYLPFLANNNLSGFHNDLMHVEESSTAQPEYANSSESAIALLRKIENAAKESAYVEQSMHEDGESLSDDDVTMEPSPQQSTSTTHINQSATPTRPIATPSGFFSRSFSAIKSKLGFTTSTPQAPSSAAAPSATTAKPLPPPNPFTDALSLPPSPIGERVHTPTRKKKKTEAMIRTLLKGVDHNDKAKAEEWANKVAPRLKNDRAFRAKRQHLETPVLFKDLNHFPSAKPWETGFGDPLADLDEDDVVPAWAVYLDMIADEEEHKTKKHKTTHEVSMDDDDVLSINEQYGANSRSRSSPKLHDSQGQSASLHDFHPRRSIDPSPMFDSPVSHRGGSNVFNELQGHDTAAQIRANDREPLQHATTESTHTHNPDMGSFSVPDDSDDDDSSMVSETADTDAVPLWTQPPPPAPVPAHAPLPGGPPADVASAQQPVDEIERQRQRLMKHTPAKPSRLREATYPSPSLFSDAGNESILAAVTPIKVAAAMFDDMPGAEPLDIDEEEVAAANAFMASDAGKQQLAANPWPAAVITYESDEEGLSSE